MRKSTMSRLVQVLALAVLAAACNAQEPEQDRPVQRAAEPAGAAPAAEQPSRPATPQAAPPSEVRAGEPEAAAQEGELPSLAQTAQEPDAATANARFRAGQHYDVLTPAQPTSVAPGKVEVAEVFWYGCPHCYSLEPYIQRWEQSGKPPAAELVRIPASLNPSWQPHARLFYAAKALGVLDKAHTDIFRAIHVERNPLNTEEAMLELLGRYDVSEEAAQEALRSFAVETEVRRADTLTRRYRLTGVPAVVVNGKYVSGVDKVGSPEALLELVNFLVAKESSPEQ
jgi:thiol:disulfide interchange protein DsbA